MARIRSVKPTYFTSRSIAALPDDTTRLAFIGIWGYVDDYGRGVDDPRLVKAAVFALNDRQTPHKVEGILSTLAAHGKIVRYEVNGERFFQVTNWEKHQRVSRPTPSLIPPLEDSDVVTASSMENIEASVATPGNHGKPAQEGKGRERRGEPSVADGLLREWYDRRDPKPVLAKNAWPGMRSVVQKALDNGYAEDTVRAALTSVDVVSAGWLEPALRKAKANNGTSFAPPATVYR